MVLVSIQVCCGAKVIRDWGLVTVNDDSTVLEVFQALCSGQIESADGFRLPEQYADSPCLCADMYCFVLYFVVSPCVLDLCQLKKKK